LLLTAAVNRRHEPAAGWNSEALADSRGRDDAVLDLQIKIAKISAPTGAESVRARFVSNELTQAGCRSVYADRTGNIVARVAPTVDAAPKAPIVCLAHLDTVFAPDAPLTVRRDESRVYCPGIGDNSRGLTALVELARILHRPDVQQQLRRPVVLVATVGEEGEGNLAGARAYFDEAASCPLGTYAAVAIDGPGDATIVHHAVGSHRVRITLLGQGGHSWADAGTPNPVHVAGMLIATIAKIAERESPFAVVTISRMGGGELLTSIPREAWVDVDIRAIDPTRLARLRTDIAHLAHQLAAEASRRCPSRPLLVRVDPLGDRPAAQLEVNHPLVQLAVRATERIERAPRSASASTDANIPLSRGIPAITVGAGGTGGNAHTVDEWFDDTESHRGLTRVLDIVTTLGCHNVW